MTAWYVVLGAGIALGAVLLLPAVRVVYAASTRVWWKLHVSLIAKRRFRRDPLSFLDEPQSPQYEQQANAIRDALLQSPVMYTVHGLGWYVTLVRDVQTESKERGQ